jgi:hypothetical protein
MLECHVVASGHRLLDRQSAGALELGMNAGLLELGQIDRGPGRSCAHSDHDTQRLPGYDDLLNAA